MSLLNKPAECTSVDAVSFKEGFVVNAQRELCEGSCNGDWRLYKQSLFALAHASSNPIRADVDIPTSEVNAELFLSIE